MQLRWRTLRADEPDYELIWFAVTVLGAAALLAWHALSLPWPDCNFRALFGIPCLTCGSTRAALALTNGNIAAAWLHNPLATLTLLGIAAYDVYAVAALLTRSRRLRVTLSRRVLAVGLIAAALLNWTYLLGHH